LQILERERLHDEAAARPQQPAERTEERAIQEIDDDDEIEGRGTEGKRARLGDDAEDARALRGAAHDRLDEVERDDGAPRAGEERRVTAGAAREVEADRIGREGGQVAGHPCRRRALADLRGVLRRPVRAVVACVATAHRFAA